jgi:hypothetical protein
MKEKILDAVLKAVVSVALAKGTTMIVDGIKSHVSVSVSIAKK